MWKLYEFVDNRVTGDGSEERRKTLSFLGTEEYDGKEEA